MRVSNGNVRKIWFDISSISESESNSAIDMIKVSDIYNGVIFRPDQILYSDELPNLERAIIKIKSENDLYQALQCASGFIKNDVKCVLYLDGGVDIEADHQRYEIARRHDVIDNDSLLESIKSHGKYDYIVLRFKDPTNIPLELVLASLQGSNTKIIKEIASDDINNDAIVTLGVMEQGADGIIFTPDNADSLKTFLEGYDKYCKAIDPIRLEICKVVESHFIGMGHRACVDLATLFADDEGIVIGSTSHGGILCCPEVFELPYMELRPFRVNAGGVHSYLFHHDESTNYLTELKAGNSVSIINHYGKVRQAVVGRVKIEVRPLRLIKCVLDSGSEINTILQDDWHVRVYGSEGEPRNISEIRPGDKLMSLSSTPGRHVGIKINETITEQ